MHNKLPNFICPGIAPVIILPSGFLPDLQFTPKIKSIELLNKSYSNLEDEYLQTS